MQWAFTVAGCKVAAFTVSFPHTDPLPPPLSHFLPTTHTLPHPIIPFPLSFLFCYFPHPLLKTPSPFPPSPFLFMTCPHTYYHINRQI